MGSAFTLPLSRTAYGFEVMPGEDLALFKTWAVQHFPLVAQLPWETFASAYLQDEPVPGYPSFRFVIFPNKAQRIFIYRTTPRYVQEQDSNLLHIFPLTPAHEKQFQDLISDLQLKHAAVRAMVLIA